MPLSLATLSKLVLNTTVHCLSVTRKLCGIQNRLNDQSSSESEFCFERNIYHPVYCLQRISDNTTWPLLFPDHSEPPVTPHIFSLLVLTQYNEKLDKLNRVNRKQIY